MDYHASTPVDPRALEAMLPYFSVHFGNAASRTHAYGWKADDAVEAARRQVAALIGASAKEIIFTSGATESNNLAIKGVASALRPKGNHIITLATEHKAVLDSCKHLQKDGFAVTTLGVRARRPGRPRPPCGRHHRQDDSHLGDGRQQRDRRAPAGARDWPDGAATAASCFTATPCRRWARCRSTSTRLPSTWSRSRRTRCTGPRASARSTSASRIASWSSSRSSTAAATNAGCAPAR